MTSRNTAPMARVAATLARAWADTRTASRLVAEQQSLPMRPARRTR
ncbi:MAG TPA: hypothetical protein VGM10_00325 [Actinocrinis sp.]